MLDTVIKIGKLYREAQDAYKFHEQIKPAMNDVEALRKKKDKDGNSIETVFYELPVIDKGDKFVFDFENLKEISDEDKQKSLYYLNFKTSMKDSEKRYLVGDIVYSQFINKKGIIEEGGNYRIHRKGRDKSSFFGAEDVAKNINNDFILKFRTAFKINKNRIEDLLLSIPSIVVHFNFRNGSWIRQKGLILCVDDILAQNFVIKHNSSDKLILDKYLYKTLGGVTPGFSDNAKYKNKLFTTDEVISMIYAAKAYQEPTIRINNIGIVALPHSDNLLSQQVVEYFNKEKRSLQIENNKQKKLARNILLSDDIFSDLIDTDFNNTIKFDIIFSSIPKSPSGVYADLIEISNIEKSFLVEIHEKINNIKERILKEVYNEYPNPKTPFSFNISSSFFKILGDVTKDKKKYQMHLLKVLPQIYTDTYYQDPILLPVFIEKIEKNIRDGGQSFTTLKYDLYFLTNIQKNNSMEKITNTKSYALGYNLGVMARQFAAWRKDCPIKSFEKSYVGNLSRRISSIMDLTKFSNFINEKLVIHNKLNLEVKNAYQLLIETIKDMEGEKYNKHNCALGFFESYYS